MDKLAIKHNQGIGLAPIFTTLPKKEREGKLDVWIEYNNEKLRITCFEPLGASDQTVLFAILYLCTNTNRGKILSDQPKSKVGVILRDELFSKKGSSERCIMVDDASEWEILRLTKKKDDSRNYETLRDILARLASVNIRVKNAKEDYVCRLLVSHVDKKTGRLRLAINSKSAEAILGKRFSFVSLADHVSLDYEPAKILHGWLSCWMGQGEGRKIGLDKLAVHIYPNFEKVSASSQRTYRSNTKRAVEMINNIGWKIKISGRGTSAMVAIKRQKSFKVADFLD